MTLLHFFEVYSGPTAFFLSIITTIVITWRLRKGRPDSVRGFFAGFLLWPAVFLLFCMVMHLAHNSFNAIVSIRAGQAVFAFYHFSLLLFGVTVGTQAVLLARQSIVHSSGNRRFNKKLYFHIGRIVVTTLPTMLFTPIGLIPTILMFISFTVSFVTHRSLAAYKAGKKVPVHSFTLEPSV